MAPISRASTTPSPVDVDLIWAVIPIGVLNVWLMSMSSIPDRIPGDWDTKKLKNSAMRISFGL